MRSEISSSRVIAAIATPAGSGGIGIVRLSGAAVEVQLIAAGLMGALPVARRASRTVFRDAAGTAIDEGLAIYFPAPHSYTGEHVLELHGHGGSVVMSLLLARCVELGASLAEPGEFTRRAFLNEKLDLAQAEAVADLIAAQSSAAARSAIRSLRGEFSRAVRGLVDELVNLRMLIEATLDFPEEDLDSVDRAEICHRLDALEKAVDGVLDRARQGRLLRNGLQVVIAGQPNVGKSSLLNLLAQDEVAIVTPIAGTTRDTVRQSIQIEGIAMEVIDTAGLRETQDEVERIGIERAWREIERADLLMLVVDARVGVTAADEEIVARVPGSIPRLTVLNKCDLLPGKMEFKSSGDRVFVSAKTGGGLGALRDALLRMAGWHSNPEDVFIGRERHIDALRRAGLRLATAKDVQERMELCAEELRLAQEALTEITGEFTADDLLGEIFSRFCIGK